MNFKAKVVRTVVAAGLSLITVTGIAFASIGTATVTDGPLRLRSEANTSSSTLTQAPKGSTVTVEADLGNGWYKVTYSGKTGYMSGEWLKVSLANTGNGAAASIGTATVTEGPLRLRSAANTSSATLAQAPKGSTVTVIADAGNGWYKVTYSGKTGYMSGDCLNISLNNANPSTNANTSANTNANTNTGASIGTAVVTADSLRLRSEANASSSTLAQVSTGSTVTVIADAGSGWYKVTYGGKTGYMSGDWLTVSLNDGTVVPAAQGTEAAQSRGLITASVLNVRSGAGTSYDKVSSLKGGTVVDILADLGNGWYQIESGYINAEYVTLVGAGYESSSELGSSAAAIARGLVGCPYVYGASGPNGFDCSGLMYYIYKQLGYSIARGSSSQYYNNGYFVSSGDMQPGDLIFFFDRRFDGSGGTLPTTHVGIYVGSGQFIHASTTSYRVQYDNLAGYYSSVVVGVKRIG